MCSCADAFPPEGDRQDQHGTGQEDAGDDRPAAEIAGCGENLGMTSLCVSCNRCFCSIEGQSMIQLGVGWCSSTCLKLCL